MLWKGFQRPKRLEFERETLTDRFGRFYAQPFERGFGTTVGNALRRVLLSSIEGAAITAVRSTASRVDQNGMPWRLTFSDYFVSRTGVDGDHRFYDVDVSSDGKLSYNDNFRDEKTGALGVNFNRRDWPGNPDAGFYKPHSEIWVCPPGICPDNAPAAVRDVAAPAKTKASSCRTSLTIHLGKVKGRKVTGGTVKYAGKTVKAKKNKKTGLWTAVLNLSKVKTSDVQGHDKGQVVREDRDADEVLRALPGDEDGVEVDKEEDVRGS